MDLKKIENQDREQIVLLSEDSFLEEAKVLANRNNLLLKNEVPSIGYYLKLGSSLTLHEVGSRSVINIDFCSGELRHRTIYGGNRSSLLAKAVGAHSKTNAPTVLDATAGLARDAFVLASLGCEVRLIERSKIIFLLLEDAIRRANADQDVASIVKKMSLSFGDAIHLMKNDNTLLDGVDVIYLDPMFPHEKRSALVKIEMRICRDIVGDDDDAEDLLNSALECDVKKIVVKRMRTAPTIGNTKPTWQLDGKTNRYDVYLK